MENHQPFGRGKDLTSLSASNSRTGMDRSGVLVGLSGTALAGLQRRQIGEDDDGDDVVEDETSRLEQHRILERLRQLKLWQDRQQMLLAEQQKLILQRLEEERQGDVIGGREAPAIQVPFQQQQLQQQRRRFSDDNDAVSAGCSASDSEDSTTESVESGIVPFDKDDGFHPELTDITEEASVLHDCTSFATEIGEGEENLLEDEEEEEGNDAGEDVVNGDEGGLFCGEETEVKIPTLNLPNSPTTNTDVETKNQSLSIDEVPIIPKIGHDVRSFEELVEIQLRKQQQIDEQIKTVVAPPTKRPFLKRGEGLERFSSRKSRPSSGRRPSVSSATSSGYHSASGGSHSSKPPSTVRSISPPPSGRSTSSSQLSAVSSSSQQNKLPQQQQQQQQQQLPRRSASASAASSNPKITASTTKKPKLTNFHKKIVEKEKQEKESACLDASPNAIITPDVKTRKVAALSVKSSPSLLPQSLKLKRDQMASLVSESNTRAITNGSAHSSYSNPSVLHKHLPAHPIVNAAVVAQPPTLPPISATPSPPKNLREYFETSLEKSIQKRRKDKQVEESVERKEIEEFELLEQLAVAVGSKDHERVHELLERDSDTNNNNRQKPFDANSYRSADDDEDEDTDAETLPSDAELFGEGTESADATLTEIEGHRGDDEEMEAITAAGIRLNDDIRKFLNGGPSSESANVKPTSTNVDDVITFDDETVWDQNSGGFSFADFGDDSCLEAVKNVSSSTPQKDAGKKLSEEEKGKGESDSVAKTSMEDTAPNPKGPSDILSDLFPKPQAPPVVPSAPVTTMAVAESKIFDQLKSQQPGTVGNAVDNSALESAKKSSTFDDAAKVVEGELSHVVKIKLLELEREIQEFKSQNECLGKLRKEKEDAVTQLKKELAEFQKEKSEELQRIEEFKDSESKRLKKDRRSFEEMQKIAREKMEKRENEEIKCLNSQIEDLQEELQKRSARWAAASTRLREKIAVLSTENAELKEEVIRLKEKAKKDLLRKHTVEKINPALLGVDVTEGSSETKSILKKSPAVGNASSPTVAATAGVSAPSKKIVTHVDTSSVAKHHASLRGKAMAGKGTAAKAPPKTSFSANPASSLKGDRQRTTLSAAISKSAASEKTTANQRQSQGAEDGEPPPTELGQPSTSKDSLQSPKEQKQSLQQLQPQEQHQSPLQRQQLKSPLDPHNSSLNSSNSESSEVPTEETLDDGSTVITYRNGTRKMISSDGSVVTCVFFNGDEKTVSSDGTTVYFYAATKTRHTTSTDGVESLHFDNGQTEISYPDGTKEVQFPDGTVKKIHASGNEDSIFPDGTVIHVEPNGRKVINFPNGQKEIHEKDRKSRTYPDGTVKTVYDDGTQETNYASGRKRVKDKDGNVILDTVISQ